MKFTPFRWWTHSTLPVEALSGLIAWYWAVVFFLPGHTIANPFYKVLAYIYPQDWLWGLFMLSLGVLHTLTVCLSVDGLRSLSLAVAVFIWTFLSVIFMVAAPLSVSPGLMALLALFSLWAWHRADKVS